ncbi:hypothetical protein C1645_739024 [Glomus cerebriforme]|uniref:NF-X1-type domain-containing protein n=1 Tax=Glomus cerebriforme TaxID=658196 RepID=A0A397SYP7_9GLOM|nr:hypothetical protein C1645_739024 [Glomus cerebriforme]
MTKKTKKKGQKSGSNSGNGATQKNTNKGGGKSKNAKASSSSKKRGGGSGGKQNYIPSSEINEIICSQQLITIANLTSSELTYNGSDRIVFIINGEPIKTVWKKILCKKKLWDQNDIRIFVSSALVTADSRTGFEVEELVAELGNPESGLKKLGEIINFPSMSCDAGLESRVLSFQYVVLPLLGLLTRTAITECILETYVHAIFMVVYTNLDSFLYDNVMKMLETLVNRNSVIDSRVSVEKLLSHERYTFVPSSLGIFFLVIVRLLKELLCRIKKASFNKTMHKIAHDLQRLKSTYQQSLQPIEQQQTLSAPIDPLINNLETRKYFFMVLEREIKIMNKMLNKQNKQNTQSHRVSFTDMRSYDLPGELSKDGIRHDNDYVNISDIYIIPTREEILCDRQPFLPSSLPNTPHFLPDGVARLLDTQFRLLREDMLKPIRGGISSFLTALSEDWSSKNNSKLSMELKKIQEEGGTFTYDNGMNDNGDLQVYTYIQFVNITCDRRKGLACTIRFTPPKIHGAINEMDRREYWEKSKRLLTGSLVALLLPSRLSQLAQLNNKYSFYFGIVTSRDEYALSRYDDYADIDISFIDSSIYHIALNEITNFDKITTQSLEKRFMVESTSVYLEAYYHILKTLQTTNPFSLPFEKYLAPNLEGKSNVDIEVKNPMYTRAPEFKFDLSVLCKNKHINLKLKVAEKNTHDEVAKNITKYSNIGKLPDGTSYGLDETQAKALISALTREIALIEGPPGTGKTVVGVQIMKVLLAKENRKAKVGPILTICFTNHALDQFLEHLLDENITNIVRLGAQTESERIKEYNLDEICKNHANNKKLIWMSHMRLDKIEKEINEIKNILFEKWISWDDIREFLMIEKRGFYNEFNNVSNSNLPYWVSATIKNPQEVEEESWDKFQTVQNKRNKKLSIFEQWLNGEDIRIINKRKGILLKQQKGDEKDQKKKNRKWMDFNEFEALKEESKSKANSNFDDSQIDYETLRWIENYNEPKTNRNLSVLLNDYSIWQMSKVERQKLHDHWRTKINEKLVKQLANLERKHKEERQVMSDIYDEGNRKILLNSDVIGMTTSGAAKFQNLIKSINPKIIICEEAGEVLEAHILSALTPSTQHLILIGDHNQLRPHIATYSLSMDSLTGKNYQLDKSLFERLVYGDKAVKIEKTQLLTQRRMRKKEISDLIRYTLYPNLIDGENTANYNNVRGAQNNVYFIDHRHPEDNFGGESTMKSHVNRYEVKMVVEMVKYFVRNGYTKPEDIAVLTPYLGQMIKIRDALAKLFVVIIDERDAQDIAEMEGRDGRNRTHDNVDTGDTLKTSLNQPITLRTVDNFQGEEANIVIISLVRNFSESGRHDSIGFLKSPNRSNVLLSRAREGMYLLGNSELMAMKSKDMWAPIIDILRKRNQIGFGMPIVCNKHSDYKNIIDKPERFAQVSPDGGCYRPCYTPLPCGHACIYKCHSDDPEHIGIDCNVPIGDIKLPGCGHVIQNAKCWQNQKKKTLRCMKLVSKKSPYCEHTQNLRCFESIYCIKCKVMCRKILKCGHECLNECFECQNHSVSHEKLFYKIPIERTQHGDCKYICNKSLICGHLCKHYCHIRNKCPPCYECKFVNSLNSKVFK